VAASRASAVALAAALGVMSAAAGVLPASAAEPMRPTLKRAWVAQVIVPTTLRAAPGGRVRGRIGTSAKWGGGPVKLLVLASASDSSGRRWLRVRLPTRPNNASAWLAADRLRLSRTTWRVHISTTRRTVTALRAGRVVRRFRAVVGTAATPTPSGLFAISERIRQGGGVLGPWALHLTAHSNVLFNFGGGLGRVAIHGRSGGLLADPLGSAASHGCIRVGNGPISWLASRALEGTPVLVR
jgi:L,D-transpeptidase-like protein